MMDRSFALTIVVACSKDGVIGNQGSIPWHLPDDLKRFRKLTWGKPLLMGRRTHESIGCALPGRLNIVITRQRGYRSNSEGVVVANTPEQAIEIARAEAKGEAMVIGGAEIYQLFLPTCSKTHLTIVDGEFSGDTSFPIELIQPPEWNLQHKEYHPADMKNRFHQEYLIFQRRF